MATRRALCCGPLAIAGPNADPAPTSAVGDLGISADAGVGQCQTFLDKTCAQVTPPDSADDHNDAFALMAERRPTRNVAPYRQFLQPRRGAAGDFMASVAGVDTCVQDTRRANSL